MNERPQMRSRIRPSADEGVDPIDARSPVVMPALTPRFEQNDLASPPVVQTPSPVTTPAVPDALPATAGRTELDTDRHSGGGAAQPRRQAAPRPVPRVPLNVDIRIEIRELLDDARAEFGGITLRHAVEEAIIDFAAKAGLTAE